MMVGTSWKNEVSVASLEVAPQVMFTPKRWQRMAWEMWTEIPPRNVVRTRSHLKFSNTVDSQHLGLGRRWSKD
jgi:hypothetical protein